MPYTKKRKRAQTSRRPPQRRRTMRVRKPLALKMHNFVERTQPFLLDVRPEALAAGYFRDFTWAQCLQVGNYAQIFEYYRINKAVVEFRYKGIGQNARVVDITGANPITPVNEVNPVLYFKVDHNDINADTLVTMKESMRTKEHQFTNNRPNFTITLKPAIQAEAYKTALTTAYRPRWGQWLSTLDDTVPHYGLKCYAVADTGAGTSYAGQLEVTTKIYFSCKCNE